jgi:predicted ATPase
MIAIEEPELFLHPHGMRHFYRLLRELASNGIQMCTRRTNALSCRLASMSRFISSESQTAART